MKSFAVKLAVIVFTTGFVIFGAEAWAADWREFAEATTGIYHYDAESITTSSEGFVRVWIHNVSKRETLLVELNCMGGDYRVLDRVEYDEASRIKSRSDNYSNPDWLKISPKSIPESLQNNVCR